MIFSDAKIPFRKKIWLLVGLFGFFTAILLRNSINLIPTLIGLMFIFVWIKTGNKSLDTMGRRIPQTYAEFFVTGIILAALVSIVFEYFGW